MYNLRIFDRKKNCLKYTMPFGRLVSFGHGTKKLTIVLNKDGSMQTTWRYRGPDLDSSIREELAMITLRLQQAIAGLRTNWVLYFEAQRTPATSYSRDTYFPDVITKAIDMERQQLFSSGRHFESDYYTTIYWMPPNDRQGKLKEMMIEGREHKKITADETMEAFQDQVLKIYSIFHSLRIPADFLDEDEMITYLHSTVSDNHRELRVPAKPLLIDQYLYDCPLYGGLEPRIGEHHIRVISPIGYINETVFGLFSVLNQLDFAYRWSSRYICLSKTDSLSVLDAIRRGWSGKIKSMATVVKELWFDREDNKNINKNAVIKTDEVENAVHAVESDTTNYGYYTTAIVVMDKDRDAADEKAKVVRQAFINLGLKAKIEEVNAVDAWLGCIPGMVGHNVRQPIVSAGNLVHMIPLSDIWAGTAWNKKLNGPPLLYTQTAGNTPYRLNLHVGDVGHALLVGPPGSGKSVHLNCIEAAWRKYKNARVVVFDKGASSKILTLGVGGDFYDLGDSKKLSFAPLAHIDDDNERQWAQEWLCDFAVNEGLEITPDVKSLIRDALSLLIPYPESMRSMSDFISNLQSETLKKTFAPLALADDKGNTGEYGKMFDSREDHLELSSWSTFEMERLMNAKKIIGPTLMYIFHRIEQMLQGEPTLIVLDECWIFFDNPMFAAKIREWLKVLRKANASVVFATQSVTDIVKSPLFDTILDSCHSRIFLPNDKALEKDEKEKYKQMGLNQRKIELIASAIPKREYYYDSPEGSRLYDLALEYCPVTMAYVSVDKRAVQRSQEIIENYGQEHFNEYWLKEHNLVLPEESKKEEFTL